MILTDTSILKFKDNGISVEPWIQENVQSASIDLTLGNTFLLPYKEGVAVDLTKDKIEYQKLTVDEIIIDPKEFLLATTKEIITLSNDFVGFVEGKSSIGRCGLSIQNAPLINPGFSGAITLELYNASENFLKITKDMHICQLILFKTLDTAVSGYSGQYQGQKEAKGSSLNF